MHASSLRYHCFVRDAGETPYPPYGIRDASKSGNDQWSGLDIDILKALSSELGFTYTIVNYDKETTETWTQLLVRMTEDTDLVLSYW